MTSKTLVAGAPRADMTEAGSFTLTALSDPASAGAGSSAQRGEAVGDRLPGEHGADHRRVALLARALESEVIPRLILSRRAAAGPSHRADADRPGPTQQDVETLTAHAIKGDVAAAAAFVGTLRARHVPTQRIYLELFAPTARHLGALWEADLCDFASVTIGLCCLQQLLLDSSQSGRTRASGRPTDKRVLLAPVPGEQHSFGLAMVGEFFRRQGWVVSSGTGTSASELVATVRAQPFSVVGFTLADETRLDALASLIREVRRASRNPQIGILVGGNIFVAQPELAVLVGADATACDGQQAVLQAEALLALLVQET